MSVSIIYWERELFWHRFFHTQGQQLQGFVYRFASKMRAEFDKSCISQQSVAFLVGSGCYP